MKNIFEEAKFGDRFVTRGGNIAVFIRNGFDKLEFIYQPYGTIYSEFTTTFDGYWFKNETNDLDIVSKYTESIDESKIDELAYENNIYDTMQEPYWSSFMKGFKTGYKKAKEE